MAYVSVLIDLASIGPAGYLTSGTLLNDMPDGLKFTGKRGDWFTFETPRELQSRLRDLARPVALVDLDTLCAVDIKGDYFEEIGEPKRR